MDFKAVNIRFNPKFYYQVLEITEKPSVACQTAVEICVWLRRAILLELKGIFSQQEVIALADAFNGLIPTWQIMCSRETLYAEMEDAEKYQKTATNHGADPVVLLNKISQLNTAQATFLQLELWSYWNRFRKIPDISTLYAILC